MEKLTVNYKGKQIELERTEDGKFILPEWLKKYEGAKSGFEPKPSREIIIVGMKPFVEGSYIDHVLNFEALPDNIKMTYPLIQTPLINKWNTTIVYPTNTLRITLAAHY